MRIDNCVMSLIFPECSLKKVCKGKEIEPYMEAKGSL